MGLKTYTCSVCGKEFHPKRIDQKYCSKSCRERARYLRHREKRLEEQRKYYREHKEKYKQYRQKYRAQRNKFVKSRKAGCPYNFDCFHCPAPDCIAD